MKRLTYTDKEMEEMPGMDCPVKQDDGSLVQDFCGRVCEEFQHNCPFEEMGKKLKAYEDAEEQGLLIKRNKADEVYLRVIACEVMKHQKNYSEDVYHMFSKGVQAFLVAIEKALAEMR